MGSAYTYRYGDLTLERSVIRGRGYSGVEALAATVTIVDSWFDAPEEAGGAYRPAIYGINSELTLYRTLITGLWRTSISVESTKTVVRETVIRDGAGLGIHAQCRSDTLDEGVYFCEGVDLQVIGSVVEGCREAGISVYGMDAQISSTVVRNTLPSLSDDSFGRGIEARCYSDGHCGRLSVESSLIANNQDVGIATFGVEVTVVGTVVRDTQQQPSDGKHGRGLNAQCDGDHGDCGQLVMMESLMEGNFECGICLFGVSAALWSSAVRNTRPSLSNDWRGGHGQGIWAGCDRSQNACGTLEMTGMLVESSTIAGVEADGVSGYLEASMISGVEPQEEDGEFGFGLLVKHATLPGALATAFDVRQSIIEAAPASGLYYSGASGSVTESRITGGSYSVGYDVLTEAPTVDDNTYLKGAISSEVTLRDLATPYWLDEIDPFENTSGY